jgi:stage V sporulation protein K
MKRITHKGETDPEAAMAKLIGLEEVKRSMHEMAARMAYDMGDKKGRKKKHNKPTNSMHMIFMGPPGTGKTTAARIMAGFLYKNGYIRKNQCVEVDGNFLNGMSPGESSKKTEMLITKSLGGVLFIDEAYALLQKNGSGYGQEAIATIVKAMEDQKDDIVFILAGYDKEMRELINSNPGIESRIKKYLWFGDYSVNNLQDIFRAMAGEHNFCVSAEMMEAFGERMRQEMNQPNFGNARTARNFLDQAIDMHATNLMDGKLDASKRYSLEGVDMPIPDKHAHV